ncbi:MAG: prepilin-type N-terminal cleavage/methylation domain-containing protein, partial [Planctomycetaceae bacterium]|nr:prepilin-type N-terminal cleavage/methylation domain-containing protein [Planctomycetaceae bacterium]
MEQWIRTMQRSGYTLIELMIATAISLILLLGVVEMFRSVAGTMQDTRNALTVSANLEQTAAVLRQDLALIPKSLAEKPAKIINSEEVSDMDGYLEIIDGDPASNPYKEDDETVGDVDDIIAFTTKPNIKVPFRGLLQEQVIERSQAEIIWFMRGTTLFRRVRLIDDQHVNDSGIFSPAELAVRDNRYGHYGAFPHAIYNVPDGKTAVDANDAKYWLRLPTLE